MRILCSLLLGLLCACSGNPAQSDPQPQDGGASLVDSAGPDHAPPAGYSMADWADMNPLDRQRAREEAAMLEELAEQGIFPENRPCQVTVKDHRSGVTIGLYNEAYVGQSTYYGQARASANYKVVPNIKMGALLKSLEDQDYFDDALDGIKMVRGAFISVVVRRGSESWTLAWGEALGEEGKEQAYSCMDSVRVVFDSHLSIQRVDNPDGSNFFEKERDRIHADNAQRLSNRKR